MQCGEADGRIALANRAGELGRGRHSNHGRRGIDADSVQIRARQRLGGERKNARPLAAGQDARHHRNLQERAGCDRHPAMGRQLSLIERQEPARRGDAVDAAVDQLIGGVLERLQHVMIG